MKESKVKSLAKALNILQCFTVDKAELGVTEISNMLGLHKSNVHNILSTFEDFEYMQKNEDNQKYSLGLKVLELSYIVNTNLGLHKYITPLINELSRKVNEIVYFAIPKAGKVIYLDAAYPETFYQVRSILGEKAEMYCTSIGKAILANLEGDEFKNAFNEQSLKKYTENTILSSEELQQELLIIKNRGYSIDNSEHEVGVKCVGVPVFSGRGSLKGALSISAPSPRITDEKISEFYGYLKDTASKISLIL